MDNSYQNLNALEETLRRMDDSFGRAGKTAKVPDGDYSVIVADLAFKTSKAGNALLLWTFDVLDGPHKGAKLWNNSMLQSEANYRFLRRDLAACGLELELLAQLPGRIRELLGVRLVIEKTTNGDFENIKILSRLPSDSPAETSPVQAPQPQEGKQVDYSAVPF